jgi:hypothetical protein
MSKPYPEALQKLIDEHEAENGAPPDRPGRSFELVIRSRRKDEPEIKRTVSLSADLGLFEDLKTSPVDPIDLLSDQGVIERVATDKYLQGRLIYAMSDAHDMEPREFARGLASGVIAQALVALRGALLDFFLDEGLPDIGQAMVTAFEAMVAGRQAMAKNIKEAGISDQIVKALEGEDVAEAVASAMDEGLAEMRRTLKSGK